MDAKTKSTQKDWDTEKRKLIDQIVVLKTENQQNHLSLKKCESEIAKISFEKQKLEQELAEKDRQFKSQMAQLRTELTDAKQENVNIKASNDKVMSDLKRENKLLIAQNKQLQTGMEQKKASNTTTKTDNASSEIFYEVEKILAHKHMKAHRQYLIRWKGYDSDGDTWEKGSDLDCPKILNKYLESIKKRK